LRSAAKQIASTNARSRGSAIFGNSVPNSPFKERPRCRTASSTRAAARREAVPGGVSVMRAALMLMLEGGFLQSNDWSSSDIAMMLWNR
jgi:hypothetical protein